MTPPTPKQFLALKILIFSLVITACGTHLGPLPTPTPSPTSLPTPTATPIPLAASVNGEEITVAEFEAELARYQQVQASLGNTVNLETATQVVLNDMIDTLLLGQGAAAYDFIVDEATVQQRIDVLTAQVGGLDALAAWESSHGYTDMDFRSALRRQIASAWMRDQVAASVSSTAEQVHVKQVLLYNTVAAEEALGLLQAGWIFDDLAAQYDPVTKGELGWFPRGYIPDPAIENAAYALQPGQYSGIVQDGAGYHILYLVERDPSRLLSPDTLLTLQERAVQSWLSQRRNESTILFAP